MDRARALYERLAADHPDNAEALLGLGRIYSMLADRDAGEPSEELWQRAGETFERLVELDPRSVVFRDSLATHLIQQAERTDDVNVALAAADRAVRLLEGMLETAPDTGRWRRMTGVALFAQARAAVALDRDEAAVKLLTRAVRTYGIDRKHLRESTFERLLETGAFAELLR